MSVCLRGWIALCILGLAFLCPAAPVVARNALSESSTTGHLGDIVVTALGWAAPDQSLPAAITALDNYSLFVREITSTDQLSRFVPGLAIRPNANGGSRMIFRNLQSAGEAMAGLYLDDILLNGSTGTGGDAGGTTPRIRLFDIDRVEVLRGPQGTLYGAGSMTGAIKLVTRKPDLNSYGGSLEGQVFSTSHGSAGYLLQGRLNVPLVAEKVGIRAVGYYEDAGGWVDNSTLSLKNFNRGRDAGGHVMLRLHPSDDLLVDFLASRQSRKGYNTAWSYQNYSENGRKYDQRVETATPQRDTISIYSGALEWELAFATLKATTSYVTRNLRYNFDYTPYFRIPLLRHPMAPGCLSYFGIPASPYSFCNPSQAMMFSDYVDSNIPATGYQPQTTKTWANEIRLTGTSEHLNWTTGIYYSSRNNFTESMIIRADATSGEMPSHLVLPSSRYDLSATVRFDRTISNRLRQIAGFGELEYKLTQSLGLIAGIRLFHYSQNATLATIVGNYALGSLESASSRNNTSETGTSAKLGIQYQPADPLLLYASATQGFRPGGVNQTVGLSDTVLPFISSYKSDHLWNYEAGIKSTWLDHHLILNAAFYEIDWSRMQIPATTADGAFGFITNAGKARIRGVEVEAALQPVPNVQLRVSGSFSSAKLLGGLTVPSGILVQGMDRDGNNIPNAPRWTAQSSVTYTPRIGDHLDMLLHADLAYTGDAWLQFLHNGDTLDRYLRHLPGYMTVGVKIGLMQSGGKWDASIYANNLFNTLGITSKLGGAFIGGTDIFAIDATSVRPRTIGISFRTRY